MNYVHNWTSPTTIKRKSTIPASMSFCLIMWACLTCGQSLEQHSKGGVVPASVYKPGEVWQKRMIPRYSGQLFNTLDSRQGENRKMAGSSLYLDELLNSKVSIQRPIQRVSSLLRQAFPEGFMPPWRIQHESHTCSETSLQILMWSASYVQKHIS